jgi:hypothetical protein
MATLVQSGGNCASAMPIESVPPTSVPTNGMKEIRPGDQADDEAELQADDRQADSVERAEAEANQRLAADVARDGGVGFDRQRADGRGIVERQGPIDRRQHLGPVAHQVERHHRGDEQQRQQVDDRDATLRQPAAKPPTTPSAWPAN